MLRALLLLAALGLAACGIGEPRLPSDRQAPVLYVALGDSTVEGVGASRRERNYVSVVHARLRAVYPQARLRNLGVGGATSADVLARQVPRAVALQPRLITVSVGPNDITTGVGVPQYERTMDTILAALQPTGALIVVNLLPDLAVTPRFRGSPEEGVVGQLSAQFNDVLRRVGPAHDAEIVDLYGPSRDEVPRRPELIAGDGYHPSDAGYARWAELMWLGIERRMSLGR